MKHLRVFETFKKEDYYVTTSREEYQNFELVSMSEENAIKIKKHCSLKLKDGGVTFQSKECKILDYERKKIEGKDRQVIYHETLEIYESNDDFFYISYYLHDWYKKVDFIDMVKCDQIDGVYEFFKDKGIYKERRIKKFNESIEEDSILSEVEDYLQEIVDVGWKIRVIEEVSIDSRWRHRKLSWDKGTSPLYPETGFEIHLEPPYGVNLTHDYDEDNSLEHFSKWSEWMSIMASVLKKLQLHVGELRVKSHFGDNVPWGGTRWLLIIVKRQKI